MDVTKSRDYQLESCIKSYIACLNLYLIIVPQIFSVQVCSSIAIPLLSVGKLWTVYTEYNALFLYYTLGRSQQGTEWVNIMIYVIVITVLV